MGKFRVREEFLMAMYGGSPDVEQHFVDACVDDAFALIYEELNAALETARAECSHEGLAALRIIERCYTRAIEFAAQCGVRREAGGARSQQLPRRAIPAARTAPLLPVTSTPPATVARDELIDSRYSTR